MDGNSQPPVPPAATVQGSSSQQTAAETTVPLSPTAVRFLLALGPPPSVHQQRRLKLPVYRPSAAARVTPQQQLLQGSSSQWVPAAAPPVAATAPRSPALLGVGRPPAPPTAALMANPSPRFKQDNYRLTLRDLQIQPAELSVYRGATTLRPELARSVDTGPCALNMQADLPSILDSDSEDELEMLD